jgi:hypothetical protein
MVHWTHGPAGGPLPRVRGARARPPDEGASVNAWPEPGAIVHVMLNDRCRPAVVFDHRVLQADPVDEPTVEIYVRVLVPNAAGILGRLQWGKLMPVQPIDMEGWVTFGRAVTDWHWPEQTHEG